MFNKTNKENKRSKRNKSAIPLWVNGMQAVLILIMLVQVYGYFFDHQSLIDAGITINGVPDLNLIYEMGARLFVMVIAAVFVMITQNPKQYLVVLIMNVFREGMEMFIDPLYPLANAPAGPLADFLIHVVIVAIEVWALITVLRIVRRENLSN